MFWSIICWCNFGNWGRSGKSRKRWFHVTRLIAVLKRATFDGKREVKLWIDEDIDTSSDIWVIFLFFFFFKDSFSDVIGKVGVLFQTGLVYARILLWCGCHVCWPLKVMKKHNKMFSIFRKILKYKIIGIVDNHVREWIVSL